MADELPKRKSKRQRPMDQSPPPTPPSEKVLKKILDALRKKQS